MESLSLVLADLLAQPLGLVAVLGFVLACVGAALLLIPGRD